MSLEDEFNELSSPVNSYESFCYAKRCSELLNSSDERERSEARTVIILYLDKRCYFSEDSKTIWDDLIESAGFYPYIKKNNIEYSSLSDEIRVESFDSKYISNVKMHLEQKKISDLLSNGKSVVVSAPTSFGKSLLIEELVASNRYRNIVVIQPTLALLDETRVKLKKYSKKYKVIVRTTQQSDTEKGNLFLLTAERVVEYNQLPPIDLLVIDEFYKLSLKREDGRVNILNNAFLKVTRNNHPQIYMMGPNITGISEGFEKKYNAIFYKTNFSMVSSKFKDMSYGLDYTKTNRVLDKVKLPRLFELLDSLEEPTLVYCSSPSRARKIMREYIKHLINFNCKADGDVPLIDWLEENVSKKWSLTKGLKYGVAIHDGSLQKHVGNAIIDYFNSNRISVIFCTSTIIEGVNTSAKNVIVFDKNKGDKELDFFDFRNIEGRSGRLMEYYVGNVYSFIPRPSQAELIVDIPFISQDKDILPDEILVNIERNDVKRELIERYESYNRIDKELLDILKKNGESINGQLSVYYALEKDILDSSKYEYISWTQYPSYKALKYLMKLADGNLFDFNDNHGVFSSDQLVYFLTSYEKTKNIMSIKQKFYDKKIASLKRQPSEEQKLKYEDESIEKAFHIYRHWFKFKVPKALRIIDSLQRYVCIKHAKKPGAYKFYVEQLENDFVPSKLSILVEYGIPVSTIGKLSGLIPNNLNEDQVLAYIEKNKKEICEKLNKYERERLLAEL